MMERCDTAQVLQDEHYALVALVTERRRGDQDVQLLDRVPGAQLHACLAPDAFVAGEGLVNRPSNKTGLAQRPVAAPGIHIPGMQAVKDLTAAVAENAAPTDAEEGTSRRVVVQDGHVSVHQKDIARYGIKQLAEQNLVAHLCHGNPHVGTIGNLYCACQHKSASFRGPEGPS